jgi:hypothetical protein
MRSADTFEQKTKELETISLPWPRFEAFESTATYNNATGEYNLPKVKIETFRGIPQWIFLRLERQNTQQRVKVNQPVIREIKFTLLGQDIKTVSDLDEEQLYHTTRRNSHPHSDSRNNQKTIGAVFLHKSDVGNFSQFKDVIGKDTLKFEITVTKLYDIYPGVATQQTDNQSALTLTDPLTFRACLIYTNYGLAGRLHDAKFWQL